MLYAFGSNGAGQLNVGHSDDLDAPTPCLLPADAGSDVKIVGGGNHTFLRIDQKVYLAGEEEPSDLPVTTKKLSESSVVELPGTALFAATWDAFAIVEPGNGASNSLIYTFGSSVKGQLGRTNAESSSSSSISGPRLTQPLALDQEVVSISGGVQHFVVVLKSGDVIGWGNGRKGQLGEPVGVIETPRKVMNIGFEVRHAVCGREFTYLLGDPGEGRHAILGSDKWRVKSHAPSDVKGWKAAGAGWANISVLLSDGRLLSWGRDDYGQLAPRELPPIDDIAVGSEHSIALTKDGDVLVWGWGEHGNCGSGVDTNGIVKGRWNVVPVPDAHPGQRVIGLGAGCATSWIWTG